MEQQTKQELDPVQMIDDHAAYLDISPHKLMLKAEMDPSSLARWRRGAMPNTRTLKKILSVSVKSED